MRYIVLFSIAIVLLISGCTTPSQFENYQKIEKKAQDVSVQADIKTVQMAQDVYRTQNNTYADSADKLQDISEINGKLEVVSATENSYEMTLTEGNQVYTVRK